MGCGKSTVAQQIAARINCFYFDLDQTIQMGEGRTVSEIFAADGEGGFRILEYEYLSGILEDYRDFPEPVIVSLGGGTVLSDACAKLIKDNAFCIYLKAPDNILSANLRTTGVKDRPLLKEESLEQQVRQMMQERGPLYESRADAVLEIGGLTDEEIADKICSKWLRG